VFLAPSHSDLSESLLITTLLGIPLREPDGKTPTPRCYFMFILVLTDTGLRGRGNLDATTQLKETERKITRVFNRNLYS